MSSSENQFNPAKLASTAMFCLLCEAICLFVQTEIDWHVLINPCKVIMHVSHAILSPGSLSGAFPEINSKLIYLRQKKHLMLCEEYPGNGFPEP